MSVSRHSSHSKADFLDLAAAGDGVDACEDFGFFEKDFLAEGRVGDTEDEFFIA